MLQNANGCPDGGGSGRFADDEAAGLPEEVEVEIHQFCDHALLILGVSLLCRGGRRGELPYEDEQECGDCPEGRRPGGGRREICGHTVVVVITAGGEGAAQGCRKGNSSKSVCCPFPVSLMLFLK